MERMMFKGLIFIIGIWAVWNMNQGMQSGVKELGEQRIKEAKEKSSKPIPSQEQN